tara:strand:+ start:195 stop:458 length:264 start_codon:yes stop_codon:yes gene_type:complete
MRTYKITHVKETDRGNETHYTIIHAGSEEEAIKKVNPEIILEVEDRGMKREDMFKEWWETWSAKVKNQRNDILYEIRKIKSPSRNKK